LSTPDFVLNKIEERAKKEGLPIIGRVKGKVVQNIVRRLGKVEALEVGTLIGYSAILIASSISEGHLTCIEKEEKYAEEAIKNIELAGLESKVTVMVGDALHLLPLKNKVLDFVLLDAEKTEYIKYLKLIEPMLHSGSIIVADNAGIFAEEMKDYLEYVRRSGKYRSSFHEFEIEQGVTDALEVSYKV
jgi:predicted O-methyltransferase YrrM